jgi:hypothetical protein
MMIVMKSCIGDAELAFSKCKALDLSLCLISMRVEGKNSSSTSTTDADNFSAFERIFCGVHWV